MNLEDISLIAIILVVAGITLGVGAQIMRSTQTDTSTVNTYTNQTITFATNNTYYNFLYKDVTGVSSVANQTQLVASTNYTVTSTGIKIFSSAGGGNFLGKYNVTFLYREPNIAYAAYTNATEGIAQLSSWIPTIALVIIASLVIGIVFSSLIIKSKE